MEGITATQTPMQAAEELVTVQRQLKLLEAQKSDLTTRKTQLSQVILDAMEAGDFPSSSRVAGATVFTQSQVWASPEYGHVRLTEVLNELGMDEYTPKTVNTNSISGFIREEIKKAEVDETASLEERIAASGLDPRLVAALKITEKTIIKVNGA